MTAAEKTGGKWEMLVDWSPIFHCHPRRRAGLNRIGGVCRPIADYFPFYCKSFTFLSSGLRLLDWSYILIWTGFGNLDYLCTQISSFDSTWYLGAVILFSHRRTRIDVFSALWSHYTIVSRSVRESMFYAPTLHSCLPLSTILTRLLFFRFLSSCQLSDT